MGRRCDNEDYEGAEDPMSPSKNKGDNNMANNITLWQFLLELLVNGQFKQIICWTNNEGEFKLVNAEEVARLWGLRKNKNNMNYDKLSRALRYYYDKNIIKKVLGQKFVYRFVSFPEIVKTESKIPFHVKMEAMGPSKVSTGPVSPYSSSGVSHSPMSSSAPSPSGSGAHNGGISSPAHHPSQQNLSTPPPAHIGSYTNLNPLAHMYQAAFSQMAAAASLGGYLSALARRPEGELPSQGTPSSSLWPAQESCGGVRSPSPQSEDSHDAPEVPLHLVSEEASRRRREEEAEERRREECRRSWHSPCHSPLRSRSPLGSPPPLSPLTPPPAKDPKGQDAGGPPPPATSPPSQPPAASKGAASRGRTGPKPKPSPLSIEAITGAPPVVSPRQFSASSLNTPVVSIPSPPYSGVGTKSPYFPLHFWSTLSPLAASLSPHYGSPRGHRHFTFPALPPQYPHLPPHVLSPLLPSTAFDFSSIASPAEKTTTVPVLQ